jgi:hypothetical protein
MRIEDFHFRLQAATFSAIRFAQTMVKDTLSLEPRFFVALNASYDGNRENDEKVYPEDDGKIAIDLSDSDVVKLLCRKEAVPQWIDIGVAFCTREFTGLSLTCCGRFQPDDAQLYSYTGGTQPFGIKSPVLPIGHKQGRRFRLPKRDEFLDRFQRFHESRKSKG